ncbi:MAG: succinate dehydrogenase, hydrophobic membrane anchor protein [Gammaproteobacteria bacterium]
MTRYAFSLKAWLLQRISAVYMALFIVYLVVYFMLRAPSSHSAWQGWLSHPAVSVASAGFLLALLLHVWIGMRDVVLDYVQPVAVRLLVLTLIAVVLMGCGLWGLRVLLLAALASMP